MKMNKHNKYISREDVNDIWAARRAKDPELEAAFQKARRHREMAEMLKDARERAKLTQAQLAERTGMRQSAIARLEMRKGGNIRLDTIWAIAAATGRRIVLAKAGGQKWRPATGPTAQAAASLRARK